MKFSYHIADERTDLFPPVDQLPTVEAEDAMKAIAKLAREGMLPAAGDTFWLRVVVEVHPNETPAKAVSIQLTPEFQIPLDWQPPEEA